MEREIEAFKIVEVDGYEYQIQHPQVEEAWDIGIELMKMIGGSAAAMVAGAKDADSAAGALKVAVDALLQKVDARTSMSMIKRMFKYVELQGKVDGDRKKLLLDDAGIKMHFRGGVGSMLKLAGEVISFTHRDFF